MDREALAWSAGFFDGEGTSHCDKSRSMNVSVAQAGSPELLYRFQRAVGGLGSVLGPYAPVKAGNQLRYVFSVQNFQGAQAVIAMLWPFLGTPKREQATRALGLANRPKRSFWGEKTHCPKAHPYDEENTYRSPSTSTARKYPARQCRECGRAATRMYLLRKKTVKSMSEAVFV